MNESWKYQNQNNSKVQNSEINRDTYIRASHDDRYEQHEEFYECDYYEDYSYDDSIYDACDGMDDAYWNIF